MKPGTQKFVAPIPHAAADVHKAVAMALKDKTWAAGVRDERILWVMNDDGVNAYFQMPEEGS
jgi:hypothetical protein